ncbi:MAG: hypothetical protein JJE46_10470, partial [Acidimicrobiia bacterium]|nr:hypothetical protein [Acidimicrobiia bacterium]
LFRSTDGAKTFKAIATDLLAGNHVIADFTNPSGTPIQFSPAYAKDHTIFGYSSQDVVRSTDGGATWKVLRLPSGESFLRRLQSSDVFSGTGSSSISKRTVAAIALGAFVVLALITMGYRQYRRRRMSESAAAVD